jgi:hypothetical protein
MGKNTEKGHRKGAVKDRTQVLNPRTGLYVKIDATTGKFMSSKKEPYKGVRQVKKK